MSETKIDLQAPEVQAAITAAIDEAVKGLKAKNEQLIGELRTARKTATVDPEEYSRLLEENRALSEQVSDLNKANKLAMSDAEKMKKLFEAENGFSSKLLIDNGITAALTGAGVKPELLKAAGALFKSQAAIKVEGDSRSAVIGDKSVNDFIKEWANTDEGKHFVAAPLNGGGGANGGGGQSGSKQVTRSAFDQMSQNDRKSFSLNGGTVIDG
jgi:hypothetical protein